MACIALPIDPVPGVYENMPMGEYLQIDAVSSSTLTRAGLKPEERSWAKIGAARAAEKQKASVAMYKGTAIHAAVFEPAEFERLAVEVESWENPSTGRQCKLAADSANLDAWAGAVAAHPGQIVCAKGWIEDLTREAKIIREHPALSEWMDSSSARELTVVWQDGETGVYCKARIDMLRHDPISLLDLKHCQRATYRAFSRRQDDLGYWFKVMFHAIALGSVYRAELAKVGRTIPKCYLLAVEEAYPHDLGLWAVSDMYEEIARYVMQTMLAEYAMCLKSGHWPGYPMKPVELIPAPYYEQVFPEVYRSQGQGGYDYDDDPFASGEIAEPEGFF